MWITTYYIDVPAIVKQNTMEENNWIMVVALESTKC